VSSTTTDASGNENTEELPKAILTLAVDQKQAEKLIYGTTNGAGYFALLSKDSATPGGGGVSANNLFS
jgi:pilus assembly protein CpaB